MNSFTCSPIGIVHSPHKTPEGAPIQPAGARDIRGTVEILPEFEEGLSDLSGFSHLILIYHFHLSGPHKLTVKPFLDKTERGLFATRAPSRPNPLGLSVVRLDGVEKNILHIRDVDLVDGTPLLDIKPYVAKFDRRTPEREGWLEKRSEEVAETTADERFVR